MYCQSRKLTSEFFLKMVVLTEFFAQPLSTGTIRIVSFCAKRESPNKNDNGNKKNKRKAITLIVDLLIELKGKGNEASIHRTEQTLTIERMSYKCFG